VTDERAPDQGAPDELVLTTQTGAVCTLTVNRPEALNALTPSLLGLLADRLSDAALNPSVRAVVLTGAGRAFSAGVDLKALAAAPPSGGDVSSSLNDPARRCCDLLSTMPKLTVAKVNGFCFTGALELALACDLMIVADEAKLGDTHAKWGLRPTWGMSARLIRVVGLTRARELSYTARTFMGTEAAAMGMAVQSVPSVELDAATDALIGEVLANSHDSLVAYKSLYREGQDRGLTDALQFEYVTQYSLGGAGGRLGTFGNKG
jgi:enoyl-CoA hydratase